MGREPEATKGESKKKKTKRKSRGSKRSNRDSRNGDKSAFEDGDVISTKEDLGLAKDVFVLSKTTKFIDDYKLKKTIGEGAFGVVGLCENLKNGKIRAVKMLSKKNLPKKDLEDIANEVQIIRKLDHPTIVKMYEEYEDHKYLYIVQELIEGGELFDELIRRKKFTEKDCACIVEQLLMALSYCHANDIVHKDLKPENVLLEKKKDIKKIKLIDFGTAQWFDRKKKMTTVIGTPYYVAPEVLKGSYDEKCDIWGVGVIMFILLSGVPPFNGKDDNAIMKAVTKGKYEFNPSKWKGVSKNAKDLINKMLTLDPSDRITAKDALDHKWFENYRSGKLKSKKLSNALSDLKKFKFEQKMQQAALGYMVTHLTTKDDVDELAEIFQSMDTNHDGKLDIDEFKEGCKKVYPEMTEEEVVKVFKDADSDNSGFIDYSEWIAATVNKKQLLNEKNLKAAFDTFDEDGDQRITLKEIKNILGKGKKINEDVWKEIMDEVDENKDGEIDFDEFKNMMNKLLN